MKTLTWFAIFHIHPLSITLAAIAGHRYISFLVSPRQDEYRGSRNDGTSKMVEICHQRLKISAQN